MARQSIPGLRLLSARPIIRIVHSIRPIAQLERAAGFRREDTAKVRLTKLEALLAQATNDVSGGSYVIRGLAVDPELVIVIPVLNSHTTEAEGTTLQALVAQAEGLALRQPVLYDL